MTEDLIKIGQITAPHGIHGEVRVFPLSNFPDRFKTLRRVLLGPDVRPVGVRLQGRVGNVIILAVEGVSDREGAEKLRQQYLQVPRSEVWPLPPDHYYVFDLIGLDVIDPEGRPLGTLVEVDSGSPGHDLYVVETALRKRYMVPAVREFVQEIDLGQGHIIVRPIPGLLED